MSQNDRDREREERDRALREKILAKRRKWGLLTAALLVLLVVVAAASIILSDERANSGAPVHGPVRIYPAMAGPVAT